jgi:hypothetical protein
MTIKIAISIAAVHRPIVGARGSSDVDIVRRPFRAYADALPFSLDYQGFEAELAGLPAPYIAPRAGGSQ